MDTREQRATIVGGFVVAVVFGIAGGSLSDVDVQTTLYAISSFGWILATALLTTTWLARGQVMPAAGFLLLTVAEPLLWVSGRPDDTGYVDAFAGAAMGYTGGLLLVAAAAAYPAAVRALAAAGAATWAVYVIRYITGADLSLDDANNLAGYITLSAAFLGVAWVELRSSSAERGSS